ncbi:MAG: hypothetical protein EOM20_04930 [Spartobacteria bacterium]|nr:hypothetical protein [Spartobacteria bacterium]
MRTAEIRIFDDIAGYIEETSDGYRFRYDGRYLERENALTLNGKKRKLTLNDFMASAAQNTRSNIGN